MKNLYESILDDEDVLMDKTNKCVLIKQFLESNYKIKGSYTINNEIVDVDGWAIVSNKNIKQLTNGFNFGTVTNFHCADCQNLLSLKGAPKKVGGSFDCGLCTRLTSLEGSPESVGSFYCDQCSNITSLKGLPRKIKNFSCTWCRNLKTLEGCPEKINGSFDCSRCDNLTTLKGGPKEVKTDFNCSYNTKLKTLKDIPKIGRNFYGQFLFSLNPQEIKTYKNNIKGKIYR